MANKTNKIIAAITKIRTMLRIKMVNHKCTTVRIQDPHLAGITNTTRKRVSTPTDAPSGPSMPTTADSGGSGGGGY